MLLLFFACGTTCEVDAPLDYAKEEHWLCKPGSDGVCPASQEVIVVEPSGDRRLETRDYNSQTGLACFVVYPTSDSTLGAGMHHDVSRVPGPKSWALHTAAPMASVCDLYIPVYRQVIIGTYAGGDSDKKQLCFENAYGDVLAAFEQFLLDEPTRGFALLGHSQGSQHLSRLLRERIETDEAVHQRLVAAYLLGWALGTDGQPTGGSFERTPYCADMDTPGCVIGFGSFLDGKRVPARGRFEEGEKRVCVHPAQPGILGPAPLAALTLPSTSKMVVPPDGVEGRNGLLIEYPGAFVAQCIGGDNDALSLTLERKDMKLAELILGGDYGAHPIDVNLVLTDLQADLARRALRWNAR